PQGAGAVRHFDNFPHGVDGAEGVRDVADGYHACARVEQLGVLVEDQVAAVVDGNNAQKRAGFLAQHLPGDDVGVVFQARDDNFVAGLHVLAAPGLRDQIDAFGGAANEDDFVLVARVEEALDLGAGELVGLGGALAELVHAAVDGGAIDGVELDEGVYYGLGFLGGGGVVEVDQGLAVNGLFGD